MEAIKKIRVWEKVRFGDVLSIKNGKDHKLINEPTGKFPIVGSGGIMGYSNNFLCDGNSVIIGRKGSINNPIFMSSKYWNVDTAFGLIPNEKLDAKFLFYFCKTFNFLKLNKATTLPSLTKTDLLEIQIPLPPLETQKRIAEILDTADALRRKDEELLKKYEDLAQAIFIDMFGDPVKNEKGWEVKKLKSLTTKIGSGATPTGGKTAYKSEGISLIRSMNVYDFSFKWKDLAFIDEIQAAKLNNVKVESKDVLFNITGASVCRCSIVPDELLPARVNQHVAIIRAKSDILNPIFLNHLLVSSSVKTKLLGVGAGGGAVMEAITKEQLEQFEIIVPPIYLQNQFKTLIQNVYTQKNTEIKTMDNSNKIFNSLIQKAFNGELAN
jgi:type I restriction enzyme, S subunit